MTIFAIEQSTSRAGIVLLRDAETAAGRAWEEERFHNQRVFEELPALFADAGMAPADVDMFAVGLGPGSFAGLRISLSLAHAAALPGAKAVRGVSSGEAMAWGLRGELTTPRVTIVGDARRRRLWWAVLRVDANGVAIEQDYCLGDAAGLARAAVDTTIVSADWDRLDADLSAIARRAGAPLIAEPRAPTARAVAELARRRHADGSGEAPMGPIYLHPPVFIKPRFPTPSSAEKRDQP